MQHVAWARRHVLDPHGALCDFAHSLCEREDRVRRPAADVAAERQEVPHPEIGGASTAGDTAVLPAKQADRSGDNELA